MIGRGKYAEIREHAKQPYVMKILALSYPRTQILWYIFTQNLQKSFPKLYMDIFC